MTCSPNKPIILLKTDRCLKCSKFFYVPEVHRITNKVNLRLLSQ